MTSSKPPRRKCPVCAQSFKNGRAMRSHMWTLANNGDPDHAAARPPSRKATVQRPSDGKRLIDLTAEEE